MCSAGRRLAPARAPPWTRTGAALHPPEADARSWTPAVRFEGFAAPEARACSQKEQTRAAHGREEFRKGKGKYVRGVVLDIPWRRGTEQGLPRGVRASENGPGKLRKRRVDEGVAGGEAPGPVRRGLEQAIGGVGKTTNLV